MDACLGADVNLVNAVDGLSGFRAKHFQIRFSLTESVPHGGNFTAHIPGLVISTKKSYQHFRTFISQNRHLHNTCHIIFSVIHNPFEAFRRLESVLNIMHARS